MDDYKIEQVYILGLNDIFWLTLVCVWDLALSVARSVWSVRVAAISD